MKVFKVWDVQTWDTGDRHSHDFYLDKSVADTEELKIFDMHGLFLETTLIVLDNLLEFSEFKNEQIRQRAMAKLTVREQEALGLI